MDITVSVEYKGEFQDFDNSNDLSDWLEYNNLQINLDSSGDDTMAIIENSFKSLDDMVVIPMTDSDDITIDFIS